MLACNRSFYSRLGILRRSLMNVLQRRLPLVTVIGNLSYRGNSARDAPAYRR